MTDQGSDPQGDPVREDEAAVDDYVGAVFGLELPEDRLGLFTGEPRPTPGDQEAQFQAYMQRYFAAAAGGVGTSVGT